MAPSKPVTVRDILFYIPNLVGYTRIATAIISFACMENHPYYTLLFYGILGFLDAFDGYAARKYNQGTQFGAVLDMVTDRCATLALTCYLWVIYPRWVFFWQLLVLLDLALHYMHMYAMLQLGSSLHKNVDAKASRILSLYYTNRKVLFLVCMANEFFYVALYLHHFNFFWLGTVVVWISAPIWLFKQFANVIQMQNAALSLASKDAEIKTLENTKKESKK